MNSDSGRVYPVVTPFLGKGASDIFINLPAFQEVLETLDVFSEVIIKGRVIDRMGLPVAGALVEMWHPLQWGVYDMEYGPAFAPVDPDTQGWICCVTDANGEYGFKTEKRTNQPGLPSASIDLKVTNENSDVVLTKLYFDEDVIDPADPYLMDMEMEERYPLMAQERNGVCEFDIVF